MDNTNSNGVVGNVDASGSMVAQVVSDLASQIVTAKSTVEKWRAYCAGKTRVCEVTGCWLWTGPTRQGARHRIADKRPVVTVDKVRTYAYRIVWALTNDQPFPCGMMALHTCDRPLCVNPAHIRPGTAQENSNDAAIRGRMRSTLTDEQVRLILALHQANPGAGLHQIAVMTRDPAIKRWNVRDVITRGSGVRRVTARAAHVLAANQALGC